MKSGKICLTPSEIWKCILNPIPLHYLNSKGEINSGCCFFFPCASNFNRLLLWTATGRAFSVTEGLVQAIAPLFFSKHLLDDELLLGKSRTFDLLRKPSYCLLQKCPEAASFPSWGFKHMMAIYLFSVLSNSFSFLWFGTGEEGSTWMAATLHSLSNRSLLRERLFFQLFLYF